MLSDRQFMEAFEDCTLPGESFHHRDHIRLAWIYLRRFGGAAASERMAGSIRRFAAYYGRNEKYHHTMTFAWVRLVDAAQQETPAIADFEDFLAAHPSLLDQRAPLKYYSSSRLENGRAGWVDPDLQPLP